jgi:hypothetical protein
MVTVTDRDRVSIGELQRAAATFFDDEARQLIYVMPVLSVAVSTDTTPL